MGPYISALEHCYEKADFLVKGLDLKKREDKMQFLIDFDEFVVVDFSRFDQSLNYELLEACETIFLSLPFAENDEFNRVLNLAWNTHGVSEVGTEYHIRGTRCSGDAWTSISNGLINRFVTWLCLHELPEGSWMSVHEGDDGCIAIAPKMWPQVSRRLEFLNSLGLSAKIDHVVGLTDVSFCGRYYFDDGGRISSHCDLKRTLAKFHTCCKDGNPQALLVAKAMSYHFSDGDTPIIGPLCEVIVDLFGHQLSDRVYQRAVDHLRLDTYARHKINWTYVRRRRLKRGQFSGPMRASIATTTGWNIEMQLAFENYYRSFTTLGYLPAEINKLPEGWTLEDDAHVHGPVNEFLL